ncbi:hypothetical protein P0F65_22030 [Sphingomonas sp. I4]
MIVGAGPIGIAVALFARIAGAGRIVLVDTRGPRLAYARDHLGLGEGVVADDALGETLAAMTGARCSTTSSTPPATSMRCAPG